MQYEEMIERLQRRLGGGTENAGTVLAATVQAISEDAWQEAADLRAELPEELQQVSPAGPGERRSLDEFVARVGALAGTQDVAQAREYAEAAFGVIGDAISAEQLRQLMQALPAEYGTLAPATAGLTGTAETVLGQVRHEASLEAVEDARALTEAVLAVVAEAASGGQTDRLAAALPQDLGDWLRATGDARHTDSDAFLVEISRRSPVTEDDTVREHTAAVFRALRQWAPDEVADTLGQLPQPLTQLAM